MSKGRPNKGVEHVNALAGGKEEKERLRTILAPFTGEMTVEEASKFLGISETRFADLRSKALQGALGGLAPRPVGRPAGEEEEIMDRVCKDLMDKLTRTEVERETLQDLFDLGLGQPGEGRSKKRGEKGKGKRRR